MRQRRAFVSALAAVSVVLGLPAGASASAAVGVDPADPDVLAAPRADGRLRFNPGGPVRGGPAG